MKKLYVLLSFLFLSTTINAQNPDAFVMTFEVGENPDLEISGLSITIPIPYDSENNFTVDFGDSTILTNQTGIISHEYNNAGTYTVSITGSFNSIEFGLLDVPPFVYLESFKLKTIEQWGTNQWKSMEQGFAKCKNLQVNATDIPDLSQTTSLQLMFLECGLLTMNESINDWDVSNITNMVGMFAYATLFNQPLGNWNVSNVTTMEGMFAYASSFNQPLNNWNVSNVTNMAKIFRGATSFNQPLNSWNVSNITDMSYMFAYTTLFNQPLNNWNVSNLTNSRYMFSYATSFNQPLDNWNVSNITGMGGMFYYCESFDQDLSGWDFSPYVSLHIQHVEIPPQDGFIAFSNISREKYDSLLLRFAELDYQYKWLLANGLQYCDIETRDYLINSLGWTIQGDSLAEDCSLEINSVEAETFISVYPNPTNGVLHISSKGNTILEEVKVYNLQGRELFNSVQNLETIRIEDLISGIYLMNIKTNQGTISKRVIKK